MKFSDVKTLVAPDGESHDLTGAKVGDDDGDASTPENTSVKGKMKVTWFDGSKPVPASMLNQKISQCGGPYTLKIEIPEDVVVNTTYGLPNSTLYGNSPGVTYYFQSNQNNASCYSLQPADMTTYPYATVGTEIKHAGGFNPDNWQKGLGFKASSGFPSTGFEKASFNLIGPGDDQTQYRCSSTDNGGKIILSGISSKTLGANCKITYNSSRRAQFIAGGTPKINLETMIAGVWTVTDTFTIPVPTKWAIGTKTIQYGNDSGGQISKSTEFPMLDYCREKIDGSSVPKTTSAQALDLSNTGKAWRQKYLFRRNELTNAPTADPATLPESAENASFSGSTNFSRDADGTFMGEWGNLTKYTGSFWTGMLMAFTAERNGDLQYTAYNDGSVIASAVSLAFTPTTACRDN